MNIFRKKSSKVEKNDSHFSDIADEFANEKSLENVTPKHIAGSTMIRIDNAMSSVEEDIKDDSNFLNKYSSCDASIFKLRIGPNYASQKAKAPGKEAFMEMLGIDCFNSERRIDHIASKIQIPDEWFVRAPPIAGVPNVFVINCQMPSDYTTMTVFSNIFNNLDNGKGQCFSLYFRLTDDTYEQLKDLDNASPALKLFAEYCINAPELDSDPNSPWKGRFKVMCNCLNLEDFGFPGFVSAYNAKPVLINLTGKLYRGVNYIEMDVNMHAFGALLRQAMSYVMPKLENMIVSMAFCIESRLDEEMPENLFACCTFNNINVSKAPVW